MSIHSLQAYWLLQTMLQIALQYLRGSHEVFEQVHR